MKDPYKVLGVSPQADDEEIKKAYRELAKKYHPDNYANTEFADIANDKMQEINEAYDTILHQRAGGQGDYGSTYGSSSSSASLSRIRELIVAGRYHEAEVYLENEQVRPAEWYYLKGLCAAGRRAYNDAAENFGRASRMDPTNSEYATMYHRFRGAQQNFGNFSPTGQMTSVSMCDICNGLICADCLCECCGGDLISCC